MQSDEGMYGADVTSSQLRAVEEKLMGRAEMLEAIVEEMMNRLPVDERSRIISAAAHSVLEQRRKRQEEEIAKVSSRGMRRAFDAIYMR